jgi:hypothetical protein
VQATSPPRALFTRVPRSGVVGSSYPGSCIARVLYGQKRPIAPVQYPTLNLHLVVVHKDAVG